MAPYLNSTHGIVTVSIIERNETLRRNLSVILSRCPSVVVLDLCDGLEHGTPWNRPCKAWAPYSGLSPRPLTSTRAAPPPHFIRPIFNLPSLNLRLL